MIELTTDQRQELTGPEPVSVIDPATRQRYVLVREELYGRMRSVIDQDTLDSQQTGQLVAETMKDYDADDPLLESYQKYQLRRQLAEEPR